MARSYLDRYDAGRVLAADLEHLRGRDDVVVLGLVRGGVPVAAVVADHLDAPLDIMVVRKLGVPGHEELAMGAIGPGGVMLMNDDVVAQLDITPEEIEREVELEHRELARREEAYRRGEPPLDLTGKAVVLVDDGLATGASMRVAVAAVRALAPARVIVAVPTAAPVTCEAFRAIADEVVCASTPARFVAVGQSYDDFRATSDGEVLQLMEAARSRRPPG